MCTACYPFIAHAHIAICVRLYWPKDIYSVIGLHSIWSKILDDDQGLGPNRSRFGVDWLKYKNIGPSSYGYMREVYWPKDIYSVIGLHSISSKILNGDQSLGPHWIRFGLDRFKYKNIECAQFITHLLPALIWLCAWGVLAKGYMAARLSYWLAA